MQIIKKKEGKTDLAKFITNRGAKAVDEALSVGWELEEAEQRWSAPKEVQLRFCTVRSKRSVL